MRLVGAFIYSSWPIQSVASFVTSRSRYTSLICKSLTTRTSSSSMQNNCKRARLELSSTMSRDNVNGSLLEGRSPYEQRIGKQITICPRCLGEGKVRGNLSKKAKARKKQMQSEESGNALSRYLNTSTKFTAQVPKKPCKGCNGTGLLQQEPTNATNLKQSTTSDMSVAIVGGGIGGFALAAALQQRNIDCVVYERDLSFEERKQGYGLTMQQGQRALRALGFFEESSDNGVTHSGSKFGIHSTRHAVHKPDGSLIGEWGLRVWGARYEKNGRSHATRQNAHISRQNLRKLLMDMLRPNTVRWGYKFIGYEQGNGRPLKLKFLHRLRGTDGKIKCNEQEVSTSILVGSDGIRSAVRTCKLGEEIAPLRYLGCIVILGIAPSPNDSQLTDGRTVWQTADGTTRLYAMPFAEPGEEVGGLEALNEGGLSMWQLSFPMEEAAAIDLGKIGSSALKAEALKRCGTWHNPIPLLLQFTPENLVTGYPCYDRALVDNNDLREGLNSTQSDAYVTLLGDAAHPMSPFKGQGANQALLDGLLLAQKLHSVVRKNDRMGQCNINTLIPESLAEFEDEMLQRSAVKVTKSAEAAQFLHSELAIKEGNLTRGAAAAAKT